MAGPSSIYPELSNRIGIKNPENLPGLSSLALLKLADECFERLKGQPLEFRKTFIWEPMIREILAFVKSAKRLVEFADRHFEAYEPYRHKAGEGIEDLLLAGLAYYLIYNGREHLKDGEGHGPRGRERLREIGRLIYDPDVEWTTAWKAGRPPCVKAPAICYAYLFFEAAGSHDAMDKISSGEHKKSILENAAFLERYRQHLRKGP